MLDFAFLLLLRPVLALGVLSLVAEGESEGEGEGEGEGGDECTPSCTASE